MWPDFSHWWGKTSQTVPPPVLPCSEDLSEKPSVQEISQVWNHTFSLKEDSPAGWKSIDFKQNVKKVAGTGSVLTYSSKPIQSESLLTVVEDSVNINTASWYGAREWNGSFWFSASKDVPGLLSVEQSDSPKSTFFPFESMPTNIFPLIVPSCSKSGANGYVCIFETNLGPLGVSLWDINSETPKQLFRQTDFQTTRFVGNNLFGIKLDTNEFQCWNLETRSLEYSLKGWIENSNLYASLGPYSQSQILFADTGSWIYAFNTDTKKLAYKMQLPIISGIGVFQKILVGNSMIYFREYSSERVMVYDILTGKQLSAFHIGGGNDYISTDDFPACVYGDAIVALKAGDRKTICFYNAKTGNVIKTFGPAPEIVTGVHCTKNRLIANCRCTTEKVPAGYLDQVIIWDITSGMQLKVIKAPDNCNLVPQDITDGRLTLYICPKDSQKKEFVKNSTLEADAKQKAKRSLENQHTSFESVQDDFHWTNDMFLQIDDQIRLQIWDTDPCTLRGEFLENFSENSSGNPIFASYESGKLVADLDDCVLVQKYK